MVQHALLAAALAALSLSSRSSARDIIIDNDFSTDTFMPILIGLSAKNDTLLGVTTLTGNTWGSQSLAWSQRYLQLAAEVYGNSSSANNSSTITTDPSKVGAYPGALNPLIRTEAFYNAGTPLTGSLTFPGFYAPQNETAEAAGSDPTGNEANATRTTQKGYAAPVKPLEGTLNQSQSINSVNYLIETAAAHRASNTPLTIVALGPLTNIALACKLDPAFASGVDLTYSGGYLNFNVQLISDGASSDFFNDLNTIIDPEAAAITVRAGFKSLTLVGEAAAVVIPSVEDLQAATSGLSNANASTANNAAVSTPGEYFAQRLLYPLEPFLPIWDETALLTALYPDTIASSTKGFVDIGTSPGSWNYGRTFAYPANQAPKYLKEVTIVTEVNQTRVLAAYADAAKAFIRQ